MSDVHQTRVYGGFADCRPWLRICVEAGCIPDVIFTLGSRYIVATSSLGDLYIKRGPRGIREVSKDPRMLSRSLHRKAIGELRRQLTDFTRPVKTVQWHPSQYVAAREKKHHTVS